MRIGSALLGLLHRRSLLVQLPLVITMVPIGLLLHATWVEPVVVEAVSARFERGVEDSVIDAVRVTLAIAALIAVLSASAAIVLLRGAMRAVVDELRVATDSIAKGNFAHRIASSRRDELGALACAIDSMAEQLEHLEQSRRRVLACVSHELRTPLTIIQCQAFTLERSEQVNDRRERLHVIQSEAMQLAALIAELVEASSIQAGGLRLQMQQQDLSLMISEHMNRHQEAASAAGVNLHFEPHRRSVDADVDESRFRRVLDNLLVNAIRHAHKGSTIKARSFVRRGGARIVEIENQCDPIEAELINVMFEPFVQGASHRGSIGLGLAIAHGIIRAHGGNLSIDAYHASRGLARFIVSIPAPNCGSSREKGKTLSDHSPASSLLGIS